MAILSNPRHEQFAQLVAQGSPASKAYILAGYDAGNADSCASRLSKHDKVSARINELRTAIAEGQVKLAIREKDQRLQRQQDTWDRMQRVITERANSPEMQTVAGGKTGLLTRKFKSLGSGPSAQVVEEYEFDAALVGEIRKHEEHAAKELGQWSETNSGMTLRAVVMMPSPGDPAAAQPAEPGRLAVEIDLKR
jgi:hypothetical protein